MGRRTAKAPDWAKGKFKHKTPGGETTEVAWDSLSSEEQKGYREKAEKKDKGSDKGWGSGQKAKAESTSQAAGEALQKAKGRLKEEGGFSSNTKELGEKTVSALDKAMADVKKALASGADTPPESILDAAKAFDDYQKMIWKRVDEDKSNGRGAMGYHDDAKAALKKLQKVSDIWGTESWGDKAVGWFKGLFSKKGSARAAHRPLRDRLVRLAYSNPDLRPQIMPLLQPRLARGFGRGDEVTPTSKFYTVAKGTRQKQMLFPGTKYNVISPPDQWGMMWVTESDGGPWGGYEFQVVADMMKKT